MIFDAVKTLARLFFTFWFYQVWGVLVVLAMGYFAYSFVIEAVKSSF